MKLICPPCPEDWLNSHAVSNRGLGGKHPILADRRRAAGENVAEQRSYGREPMIPAIPGINVLSYRRSRAAILSDAASATSELQKAAASRKARLSQ